MVRLSPQATALWGKKKVNEMGVGLWLPLIVHMIDTKNVGKWLYNCWLCDGQKSLLTRRLGEDEVIKLVQFICYIHDSGNQRSQINAYTANYYQTDQCQSDWEMDF